MHADVKTPLTAPLRYTEPTSTRLHRDSAAPAEPTSIAATNDSADSRPAFGERVASCWLKALFFTAEHASWLPRLLSGIIGRGVLLFAPAVRRATLANAERILGPGSTARKRSEIARGVVENFFYFCLDVGRSARMSPEQLVAEIASVEGREHYDRARASGRGLIIATAHMGSFEIGMAGLAMQGQKLHVIFQRDRQGLFERQRSGLRQRLGVCESPIDNGWTMWIALRDALLRGEAVVMQADRVMPGQRGVKVPFLNGHLEMPPGPAKLSRLSGAWIVPIFSIRLPDGRVRLCIEPPITPADDIDTTAANDGATTRHADPLLQKLAEAVAKYVRNYPEQWLMFQPAFSEDQSPAAKDGRS